MILSRSLSNAGYAFIFSVRSVMHKYLEKVREVTFEKIFNQRIGRKSLQILI